MSPSEQEYMIKLEERKVWDWTGILGVIITGDSVVHKGIATSQDPEHVDNLWVFALLFPEQWLHSWTTHGAADSL